MSTDHQDESIAQQRAAVREYAEAHGYEIVYEYKDEAVSGDKTEKRFGFQQMIADCVRRRDVEVVICWDQDRFGRFDSLEAGYWIKPLRDAGIGLVTVKDGAIDWNDFAGRIVYQVKQEGKHQFLIDISGNILRGQLDNAGAGYHNGGPPPYGLDRLLVDDKGVVRQRVKKGERVARPRGWHFTFAPSDDARAVEVVRWLFRSVATSDVPLRSLATQLNARGVPAPGSFTRQCPGAVLWDVNAVKNLLANPAYCGDYCWGLKPAGRYHRVIDGEMRPVPSKRRRQTNAKPAHYIRDAFEGIIDRDTWELVQRKLAERREGKTYRRSNSFALSGILCCGHCGVAMHGDCYGSTVKGRRYQYRRYVCKTGTAHGASACRCYSIREDRILPFLLRRLQEDYLAPGKLEALRAELTRQLEIRRRAAPSQAGRLRARLEELDGDIRQAAKNLARAGDNFDLLNGVLTELRAERERVERQLHQEEAEGQAGLPDLAAAVDRAVEKLRGLSEALHEADPARLREVFRQMVVRVDLYYKAAGPQGKKQWFRLERGVVRLRPQVEFVANEKGAPPASAA
jgi:DNA invertase Pin-like site-specific DNA recombinase